MLGGRQEGHGVSVMLWMRAGTMVIPVVTNPSSAVFAELHLYPLKQSLFLSLSQVSHPWPGSVLQKEHRCR